MKINAIKCLSCGDIIYSRARHDMRWCSCKMIAIDGGFDYHKVSFTDALPKSVEIEVDVTKNELFRDWNRSSDKFGLIKEHE